MNEKSFLHARAVVFIATVVFTAILVAYAADRASAAPKERVCRGAHPIDRTHEPEVFTHGVGCPQALRVLDQVFKRGQAHGLPLRVEGFRCVAPPSQFPTIECTRRRKSIDYYGAP